MPTSRFCARLGIPRRSYVRWQARERAGRPAGKGPWPAPVVDALEPVAAKYAADWPAWGHRKIHAMMAVDGHTASVSSVERALRRRDLLQPVDYQSERRQLAKARKAAFAEAPTGPLQVWQLDFSEFETTTGGVWRLAGVCDYYSKYEFGWHISPTTTGADAIAAVELAIAEAERLGRMSLPELLLDPPSGKIRRIRLVTDNGPAFRGTAFARFLAGRSDELLHIRTRRHSPGQNGVRERAFGSLKYEHLYRHEIETLDDLTREAESYRQVFNLTRPHESLGMRRPIEAHLAPTPNPKIKTTLIGNTQHSGQDF